MTKEGKNYLDIQMGEADKSAGVPQFTIVFLMLNREKT